MNKLKGLVVIILLATSFSISATALPANAAGLGDCVGGAVCSWEGAGYNGAVLRLQGNNSWWGWGKSSGGSWNDVASSFANWGNSCNAKVHADVNYSGRWINLPRSASVSYIPNFNDAASSNDWCGLGYPTNGQVY